MDELKSVLIECIGYGVTGQQLQAVEEGLSEHPGLKEKCQELGTIFTYFDQEISSRFMVAEQILDVVSDLVPSSDMLRDGVFFFDGFTGFTPVQLKFLRELLKVSSQVNVSVTMEDEPFSRGAGETADGRAEPVPGPARRRAVSFQRADGAHAGADLPGSRSRHGGAGVAGAGETAPV